MGTAPTYRSEVPPSARPEAGTRTLAELHTVWWLWLITGIAWCIAALVILQFDRASVTTVGVIIGVMFLAAGAQQFVMAEPPRWVSYFFGALFLVAGVLACIRPVNTFAGLADMLGFFFLVFGIWWTIHPFFVDREDNPAWWLGFVTGPLMVLAGFWTSGQLFFHKAYVLLVIAGVWALCHGIMDIVRAFQARSHRMRVAV